MRCACCEETLQASSYPRRIELSLQALRVGLHRYNTRWVAIALQAMEPCSLVALGRITAAMCSRIHHWSGPHVVLLVMQDLDAAANVPHNVRLSRPVYRRVQALS